MRYFVFLLILTALACNLSQDEDVKTTLAPSTVSTTIPSSSCTATNQTGQGQPLYDEPGMMTGESIGEFPPNTTLDVLAFTPGGWLKVNDGWVVGVGMNVSAVGCEAVPIEAPTPVRACQITNNTSQINTIYDEPDGTYVGRFPPNTPRYAVAQRSTQWYKIYEPAFSNYFWVEAALVRTDGACDMLPEE